MGLKFRRQLLARIYATKFWGKGATISNLPLLKFCFKINVASSSKVAADGKNFTGRVGRHYFFCSSMQLSHLPFSAWLIFKYLSITLLRFLKSTQLTNASAAPQYGGSVHILFTNWNFFKKIFNPWIFQNRQFRSALKTLPFAGFEMKRIDALWPLLRNFSGTKSQIIHEILCILCKVRSRRRVMRHFALKRFKVQCQATLREDCRFVQTYTH